MRSIFTAPCAACLVATLAGCASVDVKTAYDPKAQFAGYRSYQWLEPTSDQLAVVRNPAVFKWVRSTGVEVLNGRGFALVGDGKPDFLVAAHGWGQTSVGVQEYWAYAYDPYGFIYPAGTVAEVNAYRGGTLIIDFVDASTRKVFWRGVASAYVDETTSPRATLDTAVRSILDSYPPRPK